MQLSKKKKKKKIRRAPTFQIQPSPAADRLNYQVSPWAIMSDARLSADGADNNSWQQVVCKWNF